MKKIWVLIVMLCLTVTASAAAPLVVDNADLLTNEQEQLLSQQLENIRTSLGIDVVVLTENDLDGISPMDYADDYYDYNGYANDGVLLLLDMGQRQWWISTCGSCIDPINADLIGEQFVVFLSNGDYYDGFSLYAKLVQESMEQMDGYPQTTARDSTWHDGLGRGLLIGLVIGGIVIAVMASSMKSVRAQNNAGDYVKSDGLNLTRQEDRYLYQTVTRRARPKSNSGGGSHRGSSGRSHGGGGGRF